MLQSLPKPDSVAPVEPLSIAQRLAVLVIAVMVAILLLAVFLIQYSARANRETVTEQMLSSARAMMMAVNSQLMNKQGILIVLSGQNSWKIMIGPASMSGRNPSSPRRPKISEIESPLLIRRVARSSIHSFHMEHRCRMLAGSMRFAKSSPQDDR